MDPVTMAAVGQAAGNIQQQVAGTAQAVVGLIQKSKANKIMRSNIRPKYFAPDEIGENNDIAAARAGRGLSDASYQGYVSNNNRSLTASLDAITKNGGSSNNISELYGNNVNGFRNLAMMDEQMRANNIQQFMQSNNQVADYEDKEWQINRWAEYADKAQAAAALSKQGSENLWKGINTSGAATANMATSSLYGPQANGVFQPGQNAARPGNEANTAPPAVNAVRSQWPGLLYGKSQFESSIGMPI